MADETAPWWKSAVVYQIYPRSFASSGDTGVGDLPGITARFDHLAWLGIDAIWISPFFTSPMHDFGYDVADYCDVDPIFGCLADFDALVAAAHATNIKVMIDWVPAHSSIDHAWFVEARSSRTSGKRDWYVWRDPAPGGGPPNNWRAAFLQCPAWTLDETTGQYYLHSFLKEQPDLNWANPEVAETMLETLRFWLDRGVDGFRADVIHNIGKDPELPDAPDELAALPHVFMNDEPSTHEHLRAIRAVLDSYPGDRAMVGEIGLLNANQVASFYGSGDELHLNFNFRPLFADWSARVWTQQIEKTLGALDSVGGWPTWVLSNHDQSRHRTRYGSEARARCAALLLLTLPGTPFLYMGEELGLEDARVPESRVVDPGGRDACRAPIPWTSETHHGWRVEPWLPWPPDSGVRNAEKEREDPDSILHLYRRLLATRRGSPALALGDFELLPGPEGALFYRRSRGDDERWVALEMSGQACRIRPPGPCRIEIASDGQREGEVFDGRLGPDTGYVLEPA